MITNYNKFINTKLNEEIKDAWGKESTGGGLFGALKNLFGKLLGNISDDLKKPVNDLTSKLSKTKDQKQMKQRN